MRLKSTRTLYVPVAVALVALLMVIGMSYTLWDPHRPLTHGYQLITLQTPNIAGGQVATSPGDPQVFYFAAAVRVATSTFANMALEQLVTVLVTFAVTSLGLALWRFREKRRPMPGVQGNHPSQDDVKRG